MPAAAAHAPEQILVFAVAHGNAAPVGGHNVHCDHVVAGETMLADQPAHATTEGEARNAGRGDYAHRGSKTKRLRFAIELADRRTWLGTYGAAGRIDAYALPGPEIDREGV